MTRPVFYDYFRSTAGYRVRIACNLKGIVPERRFIHLRKGEQRSADYLKINPAGLVPYWQEGTLGFSQSLAILAHLDETHPDPPLLPNDLEGRAIAREIALTIAADIHPIGNLRVLDQLTSTYGADTDARAAWQRRWMAQGLQVVEERLASSAGLYAVGNAISIADVCLVPQLYNARRFNLDLKPFSHICAVEAAALLLPAFANAAPERQTDFEP